MADEIKKISGSKALPHSEIDKNTVVNKEMLYYIMVKHPELKFSDPIVNVARDMRIKNPDKFDGWESGEMDNKLFYRNIKKYDENKFVMQKVEFDKNKKFLVLTTDIRDKDEKYYGYEKIFASGKDKFLKKTYY